MKMSTSVAKSVKMSCVSAHRNPVLRGAKAGRMHANTVQRVGRAGGSTDSWVRNSSSSGSSDPSDRISIFHREYLIKIN